MPLKIKLKQLTIVFSVFVLSSNLFAQTSTECKVLMPELSKEYKGKCQNGLAHGKGKASGKDKYSGSFKNGLPDGKGKYSYENGNVFTGYWKSGLKDGKGQFQYTISGVSHTQKGYWKQGDYVGLTDPDILYRVTATTGIMRHEVMQSEHNNDKVIFTIMSSMLKYLPDDLNIETTSGEFMKLGKTVEITNIFFPFNCDVSYSIRVADDRKQCKFKIEILEKGKYDIVLYND